MTDVAMLDQQVGLLDRVGVDPRQLPPTQPRMPTRMPAAPPRPLHVPGRCRAAARGEPERRAIAARGPGLRPGRSAPPQLLILDEPTNHLDIELIEAVEAGLRAYDGALLVVSHDEAFLEAIGISRRLYLTGITELPTFISS